jgi:hypothetical protein
MVIRVLVIIVVMNYNDNNNNTTENPSTNNNNCQLGNFESFKTFDRTQFDNGAD